MYQPTDVYEYPCGSNQQLGCCYQSNVRGPAFGFEGISQSYEEEVNHSNNGNLEAQLQQELLTAQRKLKEKECQCVGLTEKYVKATFDFNDIRKEKEDLMKVNEVLTEKLSEITKELDKLKLGKATEEQAKNKMAQSIPRNSKLCKENSVVEEDAIPFSDTDEFPEIESGNILKRSNGHLLKKIRTLEKLLMESERQNKELKEIEKELRYCYKQREHANSRIKAILQKDESGFEDDLHQNAESYEGYASNSKQSTRMSYIDGNNKVISADSNVFNVSCKEFKYHTQSTVTYNKDSRETE